MPAKQQSSIGDSISNFFSGLWNGFEDVVSTLYHDGTSAVTAIYHDTMGMAQSSMSAATGFVTKAGDVVKTVTDGAVKDSELLIRGGEKLAEKVVDKGSKSLDNLVTTGGGVVREGLSDAQKSVGTIGSTLTSPIFIGGALVVAYLVSKNMK